MVSVINETAAISKIQEGEIKVEIQNKNVKIDEETWKELSQSKIELGYKTIGEVIRYNNRKIKQICSICNNIFEDFGNNAKPINNGRCCNICNQTIVIPERIRMMSNESSHDI